MNVKARYSGAQKRMATEPNTAYKVFLFLFVIFMFVFCTSKLWLPSNVPITNTALGTMQPCSDQISLTLSSWKYNSTTGYMEIFFDVQNNENLQSVPYEVSAKTNTRRGQPLDVSIALEEPTALVLCAEVPQSPWEYISLWVTVKDTPVNEILAEETVGANFFCDRRAVVTEDTLSPKSEIEYRTILVDIEIKKIDQMIHEVTASTEKNLAEIDLLEKDIPFINENMKYQTPEEIAESKTSINNKKSQIEGLHAQIESAQNT
ncbi:MAG: hypothetical protein RSC76_07935, partial [Oscillospiraceae bacterium]